MSSDRSRRIEVPRFGYSGVVAQQGRVILDRDFNALQSLESARKAFDALTVIGPCGTPDNGYQITIDPIIVREELLLHIPGSSPPFRLPPSNFWIGAGAMYLGGQVVTLASACTYLTQPEWPNPTPFASPQYELVTLDVTETEVGAVEDADLLDVALGGPDTTQRLKLLQRIRRTGFSAQDNVTNCSGAWAAMVASLAGQGLSFNPATMRIAPTAALQVSFTSTGGSTSSCDPVATGGYLGAENQLLRIRLSTINGQLNAVWSYDNASFLYRVDKAVNGGMMLSLTSDPPDAFHFPLAEQWVEILPAAAVYGAQNASTTGALHYVAEPSGALYQLAQPYGPAGTSDPTNYLQFSEQTLPNFVSDPLSPYFVRVWQSAQLLTLGNGTTQVTLTDSATSVSTGVIATITWPSGAAAPAEGATWEIALRPSTPQSVYPAEFLAAPQPAGGPRRWICPLAFIDWTVAAAPKVTDCRSKFENLVALTRRKPGCCTFSISPDQVTSAASLQYWINRARDIAGLAAGQDASPNFTVCLGAGTYALASPLVLDATHRGMTLEGCSGRTLLTVDSSINAAGLSVFAPGLVVLTSAANVTLRGLEIHPPEAPVPQTILTQIGVILAKTNLNIAALGNPRISFGVRAVNCAVLTIDDCSVVFQSARPDPNADLVGAAVFAQGLCPDLAVTGCYFSSDLAATFNSLHLPASATTPNFSNLLQGLSDAAIGDRAAFLTDVNLTLDTFTRNVVAANATLPASSHVVSGPVTAAAASPAVENAALLTQPATHATVTESVRLPTDTAALAAASSTNPAVVTSPAVGGNLAAAINPTIVTQPAAGGTTAATTPSATPAAPSSSPPSSPPSTPPLSAAEIRDQLMIAGFASLVGAKMAQAPSAPVIATVGVLAADNGSSALNVADLPCQLGNCAVRDTECDRVGLGVYVSATFNSARVQDNLCVGGVAGVWITLSGAVTPTVNQQQPTYYPSAGYFEECQLVQAFATILSPPVDPSPPRFIPELRPRFVPQTQLDSIIVQGNEIQTLSLVPITSPPSNPVAVSSCALLLALNRRWLVETALPESTAIVSANHFRSGSGFPAPSVLVTLPINAAFSMTGNVIANAYRQVTIDGFSQAPALSVEANSLKLATGISISGNVIHGTSNLAQLMRGRGFQPPMDSLTGLNADPS